MQKHRLLEQALPSLFPFSLPPPPPLFAPATQAMLGSLFFAVGCTRDYFCCLQSHDKPVNDLSTAVQLTNQLLCFWADGGFVHYKRVSSPSFFVSSQSVIVKTTSWFAIALGKIRTRRILRKKADCKQSINVTGERNKQYRNTVKDLLLPNTANQKDEKSHTVGLTDTAL